MNDVALLRDTCLLGKTARIDRLNSGIVGRGRICADHGPGVVLQLERPIRPDATGDVFFEVYSGETVRHETAHIAEVMDSQIRLTFEPGQVIYPPEARLWWVSAAVQGSLPMNVFGASYAVKALGPGHIAFDSANQFDEHCDQNLHLAIDSEDVEVDGTLVWQTVFGGVVHGVFQILHHDRIEYAKWRQFLVHATGVEPKYI